MFDAFPQQLFRPLASKNAPLYGIGLRALYRRLIEQHADGDECSPRAARDTIRVELLNGGSNAVWELEGDDSQDPDPDLASQIYRRLRDTGWLLEVDDVGYKKVTSFPLVVAQLLTAVSQVGGKNDLEIGSVCQGIYTNLKSLCERPVEGASLLAFCAKNARSFNNEVRIISSTTRELAHRMLNQQAGPEIFRLFFKEFVNEVVSRDFKTLNLDDNPYRYRVDITRIIYDIQRSASIKEKIASGILSAQPDQEKSIIEKRIDQDLSDIAMIFHNIPSLMDSIDRYRRSMTKRTNEAIRYVQSVAPQIGADIDSVAALVACSDEILGFPIHLVEDEYISSARLYQNPRSKEPIEPTSIRKHEKPLDKIARDRALKAYLQRRSDNPKRLTSYLERELGSKNAITTDEMAINSLDDLLAFLELRKLINDGVSQGSVFRPLLKYYKVVSNPNRLTNNEYIRAPQLIITRRSVRKEGIYNAT